MTNFGSFPINAIIMHADINQQEFRQVVSHENGITTMRDIETMKLIREESSRSGRWEIYLEDCSQQNRAWYPTLYISRKKSLNQPGTISDINTYQTEEQYKRLRDTQRARGYISTSWNASKKNPKMNTTLHAEILSRGITQSAKMTKEDRQQYLSDLFDRLKEHW